MTKVVNQNGAWIYQIGSPKINGADSTTGAQAPPPAAAPITDSTPVPAPLAGPVQVFGGSLSNPVIPSLEISLTNAGGTGVRFENNGSDSKVQQPVSAQGSGVILVPNSSVSHKNPA